MKSDPSTLQKPIPIKKLTKPLNQKKNSMPTETTLKKQKSKANLVLTEHSQTPTNLSKISSPKNSVLPQSILSPKTQPNEDFFKPERSQLKKTTIANAKLKKTGVSKHEPIKREMLPGMKSPKNGKISITHSETFLPSQKDQSMNFNEESNLTIDLETSIMKTERETDEIIEDNSILNHIMVPSGSILPDPKIEELSKTSNEHTHEIQRLKERNEQLERKLAKMKLSQQENRKKLKERISSFNQEGEETRNIKLRLAELEKQLAHFQNQNLTLKNAAQLAQASVLSAQKGTNQQTDKLQTRSSSLDYQLKIFTLQINPTPKKKSTTDQSLMTSFEDQICDNVLSFINGSGSGNFEESILSNDKIKDSRIDSLNVIPSLQIEAIKNSYEEKYQQKILQIEAFYKNGMKDIEKRYKLLVEETAEIVKSQQSEIGTLQTKMDNLYQQLQDCTCSKRQKHTPTMQTDDQKLKHMLQINQYKQKLSKKDEHLKALRQETHMKQIECKKVSSELDIERIRFNVSCETRTLNRQMVQLAEKEQVELLVEELKQEKQRIAKLITQNEKKEQLIKKMSAYHSPSNPVNKKIKK